MNLPKNPPLSNFGIKTDFFRSKLFDRLMAYDNDAVLLFSTLVAEIVEKNYALAFNEDIQLDLSERIGLDNDEIVTMIKYMLKHEILDPYMYKKYGLLTSREIQTIFFRSSKNARRRGVKIVLNHVLMDRDTRKEFHLAVDKDDPKMLIMLDAGPYDTRCKDFEHSTGMQNHIDSESKAWKEYKRRKKERADKKTARRKMKKDERKASKEKQAETSTDLAI